MNRSWSRHADPRSPWRVGAEVPPTDPNAVLLYDVMPPFLPPPPAPALTPKPLCAPPSSVMWMPMFLGEPPRPSEPNAPPPFAPPSDAEAAMRVVMLPAHLLDMLERQYEANAAPDPTGRAKPTPPPKPTPAKAAPPKPLASDAPPLAPRPARKAPPPETSNGSLYTLGQWYDGVVKRYNPVRGFGFLTAEFALTVDAPPAEAPGEKRAVSSGSGLSAAQSFLREREGRGELERRGVHLGDIFVHQSCISMDGFRSLPIGTRVRFSVALLMNTVQAVDVVVAPASTPTGAAEGGLTSSNTDRPSAERMSSSPTSAACHPRSAGESSKPESANPTTDALLESDDEKTSPTNAGDGAPFCDWGAFPPRAHQRVRTHKKGPSAHVGRRMDFAVVAVSALPAEIASQVPVGVPLVAMPREVLAEWGMDAPRSETSPSSANSAAQVEMPTPPWMRGSSDSSAESEVRHRYFVIEGRRTPPKYTRTQ